MDILLTSMDASQDLGNGSFVEVGSMHEVFSLRYTWRRVSCKMVQNFLRVANVIYGGGFQEGWIKKCWVISKITC